MKEIMSDRKRQRKHLLDYTTAARHLDLTGVAIVVLEGVRTKEASRAITILERGQHRQLRLLDAAAEKLGAPYGAVA